MFKTQITMLGMGLALSGLLGCGGSDDPGTAVKDSPLTGTVAAAPFNGKGALATTSSGQTSVTIFDKEVTCKDFGLKGSKIVLSVDMWKDGYSYQLGGSIDTPLGIPLPKYSVTFVTQEGSTPKNTIVAKGRVEVVKASSGKTAGILRIRADGGEAGSIEGQVPVTQCDG